MDRLQGLLVEAAPGWCERLRGASAASTVVVSVDAMVLSKLGVKKQLGNEVALQVRAARVEGRRGAVWLGEVLERWCDVLSPAWASAQHCGEYDAKVMVYGEAVRAVGRDFGRWLPGLFWVNFFGPPYRRLLGMERLRSTPGWRVVEVDGGVLVRLGEDPAAWDSAEYAVVEQRVREHLGAELFYSKTAPDGPGRVPDWLDARP